MTESEKAESQSLTCQHALVDDAGAADQHRVAGHDGPVARDDHDIARHQVSGQGLLDVCYDPTQRRGERQ